jgi:hypothetical protein
MPPTIILFACYALSLVAALRVARRLVPASLLHSGALALLVWMLNLLLPVIYAGMVNLLRVEAVIALGVLLWGAEWWLAGRLRPLAEPASGANSPRFALLRRVGYVLCVVMFIAAYNGILPVTLRDGTVLDVDAAWHYLPSIINMMQAGTLNHYQMFLPYFPLAYESLLVWELMLTQSYLNVPFFQQVLFAAGLLYLVLILRLLLRRFRADWRDLAVIATLLLVTSGDLQLALLHSTGKNDILLFPFTLAALYYLLRRWDGEDDDRLLVLAGAACGVLVSTKLTASLWVGLFAAGHLVWRWRGGALGWRALLRDALLVAAPALVVVLPWLVRLLWLPPLSAAQAEVSAVAAGFTIARQWNAPELLLPTLDRLPVVALVVGGLALVVWGRGGVLRSVGAALLVAGLCIQAFDRLVDQNFSLYLTMLGSSGVMLLAWWLRRERFPALLAAVCALVAGSMLIFTIVPYSAWVYPLPYIVIETFYIVMYRFTPASYPLFIACSMVAVTCCMAEQRAVPAAPMTASPSWRNHAALFAGLLLALLVQFAVYDMRGMGDRYANFNGRREDPTSFYDWFTAHITGARLYSINAPPLLLYGRDLSNQVYYATGEHSGYYGDQAYRWQDIQQLIEAERLDYIVISFNYPELLQAALPPTPEVLAEIDQMRAALRTVFEDEQITMFATSYAPPQLLGVGLGPGVAEGRMGVGVALRKTDVPVALISASVSLIAASPRKRTTCTYVRPGLSMIGALLPKTSWSAVPMLL